MTTMVSTEFGEFREGTEISVINKNFSRFPRPAVGIDVVGGVVTVAYEDNAGTYWRSSYSGGGWSTSLWRGTPATQKPTTVPVTFAVIYSNRDIAFTVSGSTPNIGKAFTVSGLGGAYDGEWTCTNVIGQNVYARMPSSIGYWTTNQVGSMSFDVLVPGVMGVPGPSGLWNETGDGLKLNENTAVYEAWNPYTKQYVNVDIGAVCSVLFNGELFNSLAGTDMPDDPFAGSGNVESLYIVPVANGSGQLSGFDFVIVWYRDTWHPPTGTPPNETPGYWTRAFSQSRKRQYSGDFFPSHAETSTYWNGPGTSPGSEGIFIVGSHDIWERVPYSLGYTRIHKSSFVNFSAYLPYLRESDQEGFYDFYNVGYPPPYMRLTWAFTGSGTNVVHGIQGSGIFFSKFYNYNGECYRAQLNGWVSPDLIWCCPAYPRMVVMVVNGALISVTVPPPPASDVETLMLSDAIFEDTPSRSPSEINPPVAYLDSKKVTRW